MTNDFEADFSDLRNINQYEEYGRFQQHLVLLEDEVRLTHYYRAIQNANVGDVVVDVGAGTGILTLMSLKKGFTSAYVIEPSKKISSYAKYLFSKNRVTDKVRIINKTLESILKEALPEKIDLIVTETISSVIFGFGCWDHFESLVSKLSIQGTMIPCRGKLLGFLANRDYSSRSNKNSGLRFLNEINIDIDLYNRTFRSGGNIFDSTNINYEISIGLHQIFEIASFDIRSIPFINMKGEQIHSTSSEIFTGIVLFWEITLDEKKPWLVFSSRDPNLTSWNPLYVPFKEDYHLAYGEIFNIQMSLLSIDSPYPYAISFCDRGKVLTQNLFW
ncbi:MAG TPA: 50S ribosomal protein L11 methyltransferase [Aquella sp.]|nr:50S ribosomal protein L11 methyltransferase [Aquella sp.]